MALQGARQTGMASAGTGWAADNSTIFYNPGALTFIKRPSIFLQMNAVRAQTAYLAPPPSNYAVTTQNPTGTPFSFFASRKCNDSCRWGLGLGIYTPFGSGLKWSDDWAGKYVVQSIKLSTIYIQPTLSYKPAKWLGLGAGFIYGLGSVDLKKAVPISSSMSNYGTATLNGDGVGLGYNLGLFLAASRKFQIGLNYRSSVRFTVPDGIIAFSNIAPSLADSFKNTFFYSQITTPAITTLGFSYHQNKWNYVLDLNYVQWSIYDSLQFDFRDNTSLLTDVSSPKLYKNSYAVRLGTEYNYSDEVDFRCGLSFDKSPVQSNYFGPETPDANKVALSSGMGFHLKHLQIDLSLLFVHGAERTIQNLETGLGGTFKTSATVLGVGLGWIF